MRPPDDDAPETFEEQSPEASFEMVAVDDEDVPVEVVLDDQIDIPI